MRRFIFVATVLMTLFLFACTKGGDSDTGPSSFIGGSDGLDIKFLEDEPPEIVLDNNQEEFFITLELENLGEFTIPSGGIIATLIGVDKSAFSLKSLTVKSTSELEGAVKVRDQTVPGTIDELSFGKANYKNNVPADFFLELIASVCYEYQTTALSNDFCLKRKPAESDEFDGCDVDKSLDVDNSGAPLKITSIDEKPSGQSQIRIVFEIENVGSGRVFAPGTFTTSCISGDKREDEVQVSISSPGTKLDIDCSALGGTSSGLTRLIDGESRIVQCKIDTSNLQEEAFTAPLEIKLDYFFKDSISQDLTIENSDF